LKGTSDQRASTGELENELRDERELPILSGEGATTHAVAYGLALHGRTDADFSNTFSTQNGRTAPATECDTCEGGDCVRAAGVLVSNFQVATTVTLPSVDDFPNLTPCQRRRVESAISGVLAPHEQQHVREFRTYNGTVRTAFNLRVCRDDFDARIQELHDGIAATRQASAQARSDALDPFNFEVDINCQDTPTSPAPPSSSKRSASDTGKETEDTGTDVG
jgi:hypothetical protein